jgi:hypothetical protein
MTAMLFDREANLIEIDLLDEARRFCCRFEGLAAVGTTEQMMRLRVRDLLNRKGGPKVGRMSRLAADLPLRSVGIAKGLGWLDNIRRRWFRGGRRVFLFLSQLLTELLQRLFQVTNALA